MSRKPVALIVAALLAVTVSEPAFAKQSRGYSGQGHGRQGYWGWAPLAMREKPRYTYAGDCGPNPPPGYRWDLKGWRTGFSDRDFSCYVLTGPN